MKDVRHEHPLNDPEHQRTCERCKQMDTLGASFAGWLEELHLNNTISDEALTSFLLIYIANITLDMAAEPGEGMIAEEQLPVLREALVREAGQAFDAAVADMRQESEGA
jgi:hypothetical protein